MFIQNPALERAYAKCRYTSPANIKDGVGVLNRKARQNNDHQAMQ